MIGVDKAPNGFRIIYHEFIVNLRFVIPISGKPKQLSLLINSILLERTGLMNRIENFNCLLRQWISHLVRKTLFFSKKIENHIGAIW